MVYLENNWEVKSEELAVVDDLLQLCAGQVAEADVANLAATHEVVERMQGLLQLHSSVPAVRLKRSEIIPKSRDSRDLPR